MFSGVTPIVAYFARMRRSQGRSAGVRPAKASTSAEISMLDRLISNGGSSSGALWEAYIVNGLVAEALAEGGPRLEINPSEIPPVEAAA